MEAVSAKRMIVKELAESRVTATHLEHTTNRSALSIKMTLGNYLLGQAGTLGEAGANNLAPASPKTKRGSASVFGAME
jgi:hypothetical protein